MYLQQMSKSRISVQQTERSRQHVPDTRTGISERPVCQPDETSVCCKTSNVMTAVQSINQSINLFSQLQDNIIE